YPLAPLSAYFTYDQFMASKAGSKAAAINNNYSNPPSEFPIVGRADIDEAGNFHGCLWNSIGDLNPVELYPPNGGLQRYAWALNNNNLPQIVGACSYMKTPGTAFESGADQHACLWNPALSYIAVPLFPQGTDASSFAYAVNNAGEVV